MLILAHSEVTNTMSTVYTTLDYECRHENKGTDLILVTRKCVVHKWDQKSYKICTVPIYIEYTQMLFLTHPEVTNTMSTVYII